jgi:hypothetical protein
MMATSLTGTKREGDKKNPQGHRAAQREKKDQKGKRKELEKPKTQSRKKEEKSENFKGKNFRG